MAETVRRIIIPPHEFHADKGWKVHPDGLLESPEGQTVFPLLDTQTFKEIGLKSYYLSNE